MKYIKNISLLILSAFFIISTCGIFLTLHECNTCEKTEFYFNGQTKAHANHCSKTQQNSVQGFSDCKEGICSVDYEHEENCCSDENWYVKITEEYTFSVTKTVFNPSLYLICELPNNVRFLPNKINQNYDEIMKPPEYSGKELLHTISVLII